MSDDPFCCRASGCRAPWVFHGLCDYHADIEDFPSAWPHMTELLYRPDVLELRRWINRIERASIANVESMFDPAHQAAEAVFGEAVAARRKHPNPKFADEEKEPVRVWAYRMAKNLSLWLQAECGIKK